MTEPTDFLSTLKRLESQATKGPWTTEILYGDELDADSAIAQIPEILCAETSDGDMETYRDVRLIVFLRNHAEALIRLVEAHRAILDILAEKEDLPEDATGQQRYEMALKEDAAWKVGYDALAALEQP